MPSKGGILNLQIVSTYSYQPKPIIAAGFARHGWSYVQATHTQSRPRDCTRSCCIFMLVHARVDYDWYACKLFSHERANPMLHAVISPCKACISQNQSILPAQLVIESMTANLNIFPQPPIVQRPWSAIWFVHVCNPGCVARSYPEFTPFSTTPWQSSKFKTQRLSHVSGQANARSVFPPPNNFSCS